MQQWKAQFLPKQRFSGNECIVEEGTVVVGKAYSGEKRTDGFVFLGELSDPWTV
jgi:hypothetical protein